MINLEQLKLLLDLLRPWGCYIDGTELSDQILNHLKQLRRFTFNIKSFFNEFNSKMALSINEVVQRSFSAKHFQQVISRVYNDANTNSYTCHIYSLPYDFEYLCDLDNFFPGGPFQRVRFLTMRDESPFEDALFRVISHDMPYLEQLAVWNKYPQKNKRRSSTMLVFLCLKHLCLKYAHDDYVALFLQKKNTFLPRLLNLRVRIELLRRITKDSDGHSSHLNIHGISYGGLNDMFL